MSFKKFKTSVLNKNNVSVSDDNIKKKIDSESNSSGTIRSKIKSDQQNTKSKSKILSKNSYGIVKKKNDCSKNKGKSLDNNNDDHSYVDQNVVVSKLKIPSKIKKKTNKNSNNNSKDDNEELNQKIETIYLRKRKRDDDHHIDKNYSINEEKKKVKKRKRVNFLNKTTDEDDDFKNQQDDINKENNNFEEQHLEIEGENREKRVDKRTNLDDNDDSDSNSNSIPKTNIELKQVLRDLKVKLIHEVPKQHLLESNAGSHAPSSDVIRNFEKYVPLKKGVYTKEEDRIIIKNWKNFCKLHNWDCSNYQPFLNWRQDWLFIVKHFEQRRKFVQFLANGLPNRTLYSVNHRFRNLHASHLQSRYTFREDVIILNYMEENSNSNQSHVFSDLAKVLNRTRASVWRRYRILKKKE
ncbi:putative uncharacterized protein DDB_G0282499 [Leptopilina boulardi]|uniref:putative uncharacterized protein DDB_G0282499 n=1 Tax=Leptopilina boulardi TaxID=63433 RepID=UPI0021F52059|nr:putative uncharacterized protein DDB_G0282499 [Leptopilina boulardi]